MKIQFLLVQTEELPYKLIDLNKLFFISSKYVNPNRPQTQNSFYFLKKSPKKNTFF